MAFARTLAELAAVRDGRVVSIARRRAETLGEQAAVREAQRDFGGAERLLRDAMALLDLEYPGSAALNGGKARLAAFLARRGQVPQGLALYREVVAGLATGGGTTGFQTLLAPYFALLVRELLAPPGLMADFFLASETLVRPGAADTQAVLARKLSGGSDDAARLFRQSVTLTRDGERARVELARLAALPAPPRPATRSRGWRRCAARSRRCRPIRWRRRPSSPPTPLQRRRRPAADAGRAACRAEARRSLCEARGGAGHCLRRADLAHRRDLVVRGHNYQAAGRRAAHLPVRRRRRAPALHPAVRARRAGARAGEAYRVRADGAMLSLPLALLVADRASAEAYAARQKRAGADAFDFRGIAWLGRRADISTAVSARGFRDVRRTPLSAARRDYLGFGQNAPVPAFERVSGARVDCSWPLAQWDRPIAATERRAASGLVGHDRSAVVTGAAFSDDAIKACRDPADYRIVHFATHGLVTAPRVDCPARPARLASFGAAGSDGLLSFAEIFDLRLDADLVIVSACDTAGEATVAATRETGLGSGGGSALDGLVHAFVGAGGRSVLASHWPAPDDYDATGSLIASLFETAPGTGVADALRQGQLRLMDGAETSHPYHWAGFAVIGDGAQPVRRPAPAQVAGVTR